MKKLVAAFCVISFLLCTAIPAFAAEQVKTQVLDVEVYDSFHDGLARAWSLNSAGNWLSGYFVDSNGQKCLPWDGNNDNFSEGLACTETTDGKQYFINKAGKTVFYVPDVCRVHSGYFGASGAGFKEGRDIVCRRDNSHAVGAIDNTGKLVIPCEYWEISAFSNGCAIAAKDQKMGLIDENGKVVIPFVYEYGEVLTDGFAFTKSSNFWSIWEKTPWWTYHEADSYDIYDANANLILTDCDVPVDMDGGVIITSEAVGYSESGLPRYQYRMLDYSGQTIYTAPTDKSIFYLGDGLYQLKESYYYSQLMDSSGNLICDTKFGFIQPFSGGYAIVKDQNNKDGKYGIIDNRGILIVPYSYEMPGNASSSYSNIEDGVTVLIDAATGKSVIITLPKTAAQGTTEPVTYTAAPSAARVLINGKEVAFDAYTINNNNYFKLRDLAYALRSDEKKFDVIWNGDKNSIELASGQNYTIVGGEMSTGDGTSKRCTLNTAKIYLDGREITLTAYSIGGNNYFKLRDVMKTFDIAVGWDEDSSTIAVDTTWGYSE